MNPLDSLNSDHRDRENTPALSSGYLIISHNFDLIITEGFIPQLNPSKLQPQPQYITQIKQYEAFRHPVRQHPICACGFPLLGFRPSHRLEYAANSEQG